MLALVIALFATILLAPAALAQEQYTVWASVIFSRIGERTPLALGDLPTELTSLGAQQSYASGSFFRDRYVSSESGDAPIYGLSDSEIDNTQVYIQALDLESCVTAAQAFMQGFYPPFTLNASAAPLLDETSLLANGSYVTAPLSGYQYPQIHVAGPLDFEFPYLGGSLDCPAFDYAATNYTTTTSFTETQTASKSIYKAIGAPLLSDVLSEDAWDYVNAYDIFDYVSYLNTHNTTVAALLSEPQYIDPSSKISYLNTLRWLADQQQWAELGNLETYNSISASTRLPDSLDGSISTIAGNMLASKMLAQLQSFIETDGEYYQLSVLFGDFDPLVSLFALLDLPNIDHSFYGLPEFASSAVFELYSYTNSSSSEDPVMPDADDLWVQFFFRNGTDSDADYQSYPLFNQGPSGTEMLWADFEALMLSISLGDIGDWCTQCGAVNLLCAVFNSTLREEDTISSSDGSNTASSSATHPTLRPVIAGVIGAVLALAIAGLLFCLSVLLLGVRLHRNSRKSRKSDLGGFKGSAKLASDRDLTLPKGGAVVGATVERSSSQQESEGPRERIGSWEMKDAEAAGKFASFGAGGNEGEVDKKRFSLNENDEDEDRIDPFQEPVQPSERV